MPGSKRQDSVLAQVDMLLTMARRTQQNGDLYASLDLATTAQELLTLRRNLDLAKQRLERDQRRLPPKGCG